MVPTAHYGGANIHPTLAHGPDVCWSCHAEQALCLFHLAFEQDRPWNAPHDILEIFATRPSSAFSRRFCCAASHTDEPACTRAGVLHSRACQAPDRAACTGVVFVSSGSSAIPGMLMNAILNMIIFQTQISALRHIACLQGACCRQMLHFASRLILHWQWGLVR